MPGERRTRWMVLLYMLLIAGLAWLWRKWFLKRHAEKEEVMALAREQEKRQWMSEMRAQMIKEGYSMQMKGSDKVEEKEPEVEVYHESDLVDDQGFVRQEKKEEPKQTLHRTIGDLVEFVKDICDSYEAPAEKRMKFIFNSAFDKIELKFDPEKLREVIITLLNNAVKFSMSGSKVQLTTLKPTQDRAAILVADSGIGIKDDLKEHLFDPFVGEEGIGLDVAKQIVEAHYGTISVSDNPGGGTVFTISLPVEDPDVEEAVIVE